MGYYAEYLSLLKTQGAEALTSERKSQLRRIGQLRERNVLVIASDMSGKPDKAKAPIGIDYTDKIAVLDQLDTMSGDNIDVILETPGGSAEITEDIVMMLRSRFHGMVSFIIPGTAKSAGTIMVMSGDEILMSQDSTLGPIDAQIFVNGRMISAEACLTGLDNIMQEVRDTNGLNAAYIPILQGITPGEIQSWKNAQDFSFKLVSEWLHKWKFGHWQTHSSSGKPVTEEEKIFRAEEIAKELRNHSRWLTHGRSIRMGDLQEMGLQITDYSQNIELNIAIRRYYTLVQMVFEISHVYKLFETPETQIMRILSTQQQPNVNPFINIDFICSRCKKIIKIQCDLLPGLPLQKDRILFPKNNKLKCIHCGEINDLSQIRAQIEINTGKQIL